MPQRKKFSLGSKSNYPSDLSDLEWKQIKCFFELDYSKGGRPLKYSKRQILNAIFYIARTGCQWSFLPKDFPPWKTVYTHFWRWQRKHLFEQLHNELRKHLRVLMGRSEEPSAAIVDSQSTKTTERGGFKGFDNGKKVKGRKRFIVFDTQGLILNCHVTAANVSEKQGFIELFNRNSLPTVEKIWVDWAYTGYDLKIFAANIGKDLEIIKRSEEKKRL